MLDRVWILAGVEGLVLLSYCIYLTWYYAAKGRTPFSVYLITIFSFFLGYMVIFMIPLDIYTVSYYRDSSHYISIS